MAKASRLKLHNELKELLGSESVYYNSPGSEEMKYPAIRYSRKSIDTRYANDAIYSMKDCYEIIVISRMPDDPVIEKLLAMPYCSYDRPYKADNLNHDVFTLYY